MSASRVEPYTGTVPNRGQSQAAFNTNVSNFLNYIDALAPDINEFAGYLENLSAQTVALANVTVWAVGTTYNTGDTVYGSDGLTYRCTNDSVTGDDPVGSVTGNWIRIIFFPGENVATGLFRNLAISATGTNGVISISADMLMLRSSTDAKRGKVFTGVSLGPSTALSGTGAGRIDTGTVASNTWYHLYAIGKDDGTIGGIYSLSPTAPALPAGYSYYMRLGAFRTDSTANKYPLSYQQKGRDAAYKVAAGSNVTAYPLIASGIQGTWNLATPVYAPSSISAFAPPTSSHISIFAHRQGTSGDFNFYAAPAAGFQGINSVIPPPISMNGQVYALSGPAIMALESTNIYISASNAATSVRAYGWRDNI
jgi:hypothetical protein